MYTRMCIINFIEGHALIHREFNTCLEEIDPDLTGPLAFQSKMAFRFFQEYQK